MNDISVVIEWEQIKCKAKSARLTIDTDNGAYLVKQGGDGIKKLNTMGDLNLFVSGYLSGFKCELPAL